MAISAALVKELRERTGAGMMECKKALVEVGGDLEAAVERMRKAGLAKADKKSGRVAAEGRIATELSGDGKRAAMVEVNCETDFVAQGEDFKDFTQAVARRVLDSDPTGLDELMDMPLQEGGDKTVEETRKELIAKIGENVQVRRFARFETDDQFGVYMHGNRIGVLIDVKGGDPELRKDLAMHIAASRPGWVREDEVPGDVLSKEKEIFAAQAREGNKPDNIIEKMVEGRMRKYLGEITLLGQPFVKDPDVTVAKLLDQKGAEVSRFERLEVGEGIEKKSECFADEVMAQVRGD